MLLNYHISAYARCFVRKVCSLVRSTWGTSLGEDKLGARGQCCIAAYKFQMVLHHPIVLDTSTLKTTPGSFRPTLLLNPTHRCGPWSPCVAQKCRNELAPLAAFLGTQSEELTLRPLGVPFPTPASNFWGLLPLPPPPVPFNFPPAQHSGLRLGAIARLGCELRS